MHCLPYSVYTWVCDGVVGQQVLIDQLLIYSTDCELHTIIVVVNLIYGGENTKTLKCSKPPNLNY